MNNVNGETEAQSKVPKRPILPIRFFLPRYMVPDSKKLGDDFGAKAIYLAFLAIAWPALAEQVLAGIINFVDTLMVSSVGDAAVAAVGLTTQPRMIFQVVLMSFATSVNAVVARRKGEGNQAGANRVLTSMLPINLLIAVFFFCVGYAVADPILRFIGAKPGETLTEAIEYFRITMFGLIFVSVTITINGAYRGCGKTRITMVTNIVANLVNCCFNALLINGLFFFPKLGVKGAAIATVLGQFVAMVIAISSVRRKNAYLFIKVRDLFRIDPQAVRPVLFVFSGAMFEQLFLRIGFFSFAKLVAGLGTLDYATHQILMTVLNLTYTVGEGLSIAASSLVGQNLGMKRPDRSLAFGKVAQRIGLLVSAVLCPLFIILRRIIMTWFSDTPEVIDKGATILIMVSVILFFQIQQVMFGGTLRGAGDTRFMAIVSLVCVALVRPILCYVLTVAYPLGLIGAWWAVLTDQILRAAFACIRFYRQKWAKVKL